MHGKVIRVAQVIGPAVNGGTEAFVMNYYRKIDHSKIEFDFLVENESRIINQEQISKFGKGKVIIIPSYKRPMKYVSSLTKIFQDEQYDIVHSNMNALSFFTLKAAKKAGIVKRIAHSHSTSNKGEFIRNLIKLCLKPLSLKYPTYLCACSKSAGIWLFGQKKWLRGDITLIPNAIDLEQFKFNISARKRVREEYGINDSTFVLGTVGRLVTQKNPLFTVDVFYEYLKRNPNSILLFVGEGPLQKKIQKHAIKYGILDKIIFAGSHHHTEYYYSAMDSFIFPSLYEGLGISLVEAQASGLICIGSTAIPSETMVISSTKYLALKCSAKEWALNIPIRDYGRKQQTSLFIKNHYCIQNEAMKLVDMYENMMKA